MTPNSPFDFKKVEALRKHLLLTPRELAQIFGVSHAAYYAWLKGTPIRKSNVETTRRQLKKLLALVEEHNWPTPEAKVQPRKVRFDRLQKLLESYN